MREKRNFQGDKIDLNCRSLVAVARDAQCNMTCIFSSQLVLFPLICLRQTYQALCTGALVNTVMADLMICHNGFTFRVLPTEEYTVLSVLCQCVCGQQCSSQFPEHMPNLCFHLKHPFFCQYQQGTLIAFFLTCTVTLRECQTISESGSTASRSTRSHKQWS